MQAGAHLLRDGFHGPVALFTRSECKQIAAYLDRTDLPAASVWSKGRAVRERFLYELATHPEILRPVSEVLGEDVVLWGASSVRRRPGEIHPWHSDIESHAPEGGFVSVWIGIEHTSRESSLQLVGGSHKLGLSVQEARAAMGLQREQATRETLLELARIRDPRAQLITPDMTNGDGIYFDGRLWHGTDNRRRTGARLALIFQYAAAECPVRIPDWDQLDWPFRFRNEPRPPVILVRGTDHGGHNRVVPAPPPSSASTSVLDTAVHTFDLPLADGQLDDTWRPFSAFRGPTSICADMSCHASVLGGGHSPHPPHAHVEEEILIPLHGEVELIIPSGPSDPAPRSERLRPGSFVYYPSSQHHTINNPGTSPVGYLMLKWRAHSTGTGRLLGTEVVQFGETSPLGAPRPFWSTLLLEGPTDCLGKLHAHLSVLEPGAGYEPHRDAHDVAIVTLEGTVETLGQRIEPLSVVYCSAGELHGMRNVGAEPARYLVFEFHSGTASFRTPRSLPRRVGSVFGRVSKRLLRPLRRL